MYLTNQMRDALRGVTGSRKWTFRYDRVDKNGNVIGTEDVVDCSIQNNDEATEVKRTCKVTLSPTTTFNFLQHSLRPVAILDDPTSSLTYSFTLGTFLLAQPSISPDDPLAPVDCDGFDWLLKASEARNPTRAVSTDPTYGGSNYYAIIKQLLANAGFPTIAVDASARNKVPVAPFEWDPGTSYLSMVNDLLAGLNFVPLHCDAFGIPTSAPYQDPQSQSSVWSYTRDTNSVTILGSTVVEQDYWNLPNQWVGVVSEPDQPELKKTVTNDDPSSPYSTVSRGRTITRMLTPEELGKPPDQATLDAVVQRYADEVSMQQEVVKFSSAIMPIHDTGDMVWLDYGLGTFKFREQSWEMDLTHGGLMTHVVKRSVQL